MSVDVLGNVLTFADPFVLALLLAVPALVALHLSRERRGKALLFPSVGMIPTRGRPWHARLRPILPLLRVGALVLLIVALARPEIVRASEISAEGIDIAITLDISGSMSSPDFGSGGRTRIAAVKRVVHDFVGGLANDRVGLVVFGSEALVLAPLTLDHAVVQRLADPLEANGRLVGGATAIGTGLATALNVMRESTARSKVVILLTDGENNTGQIAPIDAARVAELIGVRVYTIGAVPSDERQRGAVQVDEALMREMAESTGGRYFSASDETALRQIYAEIAQLERSRVGVRAQFASYEDVMLPFLLAGVLLLIVELLFSLTVLRRSP